MHLSYVPAVFIIAAKTAKLAASACQLLQFLFNDLVILSARRPISTLSKQGSRITLTWVLPRGGHHEPYLTQHSDCSWRPRRHFDHRAVFDSGEPLPPDHRREGVNSARPQGSGGRSEFVAAWRRADCEGSLDRR